MITTPEVSLGEMLVGYFSCSVLWHEGFRILAFLSLSPAFFLAFFLSFFLNTNILVVVDSIEKCPPPLWMKIDGM